MRGLQTLESETLQPALGASSTRWGCDDTQLTCSPVCLRTVGVVTTNVADSECAGAPEACSCSCLYDAQWMWCGAHVVCTASSSSTAQTKVVGDLVCSSRGTPKPAPSEFGEFREDEGCQFRSVARGDRPTEECMATTPRTDAEAQLVLDTASLDMEIFSFAAPAALLAVALVA